MACGSHSTTTMLRYEQSTHASVFSLSLAAPCVTQEDGGPPPSPVTIHLLPSPDLAQQTSREEDQRERRENKPSQVEDKPTPSSIPRRRSQQRRDRLALRKRRKRTRPGMFAALQRFSPTRLMRKAKMMLRSVQSE